MVLASRSLNKQKQKQKISRWINKSVTKTKKTRWKINLYWQISDINEKYGQQKNKLVIKNTSTMELEPTTSRLKVLHSTDWARHTLLLHIRARRHRSWRRARYHVGATSFRLCQRSTYLGAIAYGAEMCYVGAIGYGAEQRVQKWH